MTIVPILRPALITALLLAALAVLSTPASAQCAGDCNGDGEVAINELITSVNIALGSALVSTCPSVDANDDGEVAINELIGAVNNALNGCTIGGTPTNTPTTPATPTPTPTGPTPTATRTVPVGGTCGDGLVDNFVGETCDDGNRIDNDGCPSNCRVLPCPPSGQRIFVDVNFSTSPETFLQTIVFFIRYPDGTLDVPGASNDPPVIAAVTSDIYAVTPRDFDYATRVLLEDPSLLGYSDGTAMTVEFEVCAGAGVPPLSAIQCIVESASDSDFVDVPSEQVACTLARP